jgi:hypothetical protein
VELVYKREQEPSTKTPLTYREYAYRVAPGTEPLVAKALVIAQFELVKATLVSARAGQLVNLAIFDVAFTGKPPVPPLVTLSWKDWKGDTTIEFPRSKTASKAPPRPTDASRPPRAPEPVAPAPAVASAPPPPPPPPPLAAVPLAAATTMGQYDTLPSAGVPTAVTVAVAQAAAAAKGPSTAPHQTTAQPPLPSVVVEPPRVPSPPPPPPPPPPVAVVPSVVVAPPPPAPAVVQQQQPAPVAARPPPSPVASPPSSGSVPTPFPGGPRRSRPPGAITRMRGDELIADLFEVMHDLHFLRDAIEGADFCLTLALEKMPSRAGLVHLYDIDKREFVVTCARGVGSEALLLRRYPENDPLLRAAMRKQRATVIIDARSGDAAAADRYRVLGGAKSVVVAPVMLAGRFLGALELLDPIDGAPFTDNEGHALSYIGEQFAEFVASRGVLLDPERIIPKPAAAR